MSASRLSRVGKTRSIAKERINPLNVNGDRMQVISPRYVSQARHLRRLDDARVA